MSDGFFIVDFLNDVAPGIVINVVGSEAHHMAVVRRLAVGEAVTLTNGQGAGIRGVVCEASKSRVGVEVREVFLSGREQPIVVVFQALPKQDRGELAVDLMTEAGVSDITVWRAARSQVTWSGERGIKAHQKWIAAAREASKQARRFWVPDVTEALSPREAVSAATDLDALIIMHEKATTPISEAIIPSQGVIGIVIGPEGGLTDEEVAGFEAVGGKTYSMGSTVLRTSTAGAIAVTQVRLLAQLHKKGTLTSPANRPSAPSFCAKSQNPRVVGLDGSCDSAQDDGKKSRRMTAARMTDQGQNISQTATTANE